MDKETNKNKNNIKMRWCKVRQESIRSLRPDYMTATIGNTCGLGVEKRGFSHYWLQQKQTLSAHD